MVLTYSEFIKNRLFFDVRKFDFDNRGSKTFAKFSSVLLALNEQKVTHMIKNTKGTYDFYSGDKKVTIKGVDKEYKMRLATSGVFKVQGNADFLVKTNNAELFLKILDEPKKSDIGIIEFQGKRFEFSGISYNKQSYNKRYENAKKLPIPTYVEEYFISYMFYLTGSFYNNFGCKTPDMTCHVVALNSGLHISYVTKIAKSLQK